MKCKRAEERLSIQVYMSMPVSVYGSINVWSPFPYFQPVKEKLKAVDSMTFVAITLIDARYAHCNVNTTVNLTTTLKLSILSCNLQSNCLWTVK